MSYLSNSEVCSKLRLKFLILISVSEYETNNFILLTIKMHSSFVSFESTVTQFEMFNASVLYSGKFSIKSLKFLYPKRL